MEPSILQSVKKALGLELDDTAFDQELVLYINSALSVLRQLGVGPLSGFMIEGPDAVWATFLTDEKKLNFVKPYVYMKVRMVFDPPGTAALITAFEKMIEEYEWRCVFTDSEKTFTEPKDNLIELDGGTP